MWLLLLRGASDISVAMWSRWSHWAHLRPKGWGNAVFRHFNPHRRTDSQDPGVTRALILRYGLDCLESLRTIFCLGSWRKSSSKYVTLRFWLYTYIWRHDIWYPCRLLLILMIEIVLTLYSYSNNKTWNLAYQAFFGYYKVKPYPPACVALCDGT